MMRRLSLTLYNLLFIPLVLILLPSYLLRIWKRGGYQDKFAQRFGIIDEKTAARISVGRIWLHAVSVGEVGIALKFATEFHARNPASQFLISTTTSTGLAILNRHAAEWLEPLASPIDFPIITRCLVRKLQPLALLMIEADLWPNRIAACKALGIPVALLNARLSQRSEKRFRWARAITAPLFNQLDLITLTEKEDLARWISLGVRNEILHWTGNIKYDTHSTPAPPPFKLPSFLGWNPEDPILLAASTHQGEEEEIAQAFLMLRKEFPSLRLMIAPRHVERRASILNSLEQLGLSVALRSSEKQEKSDILLLDTTGELSEWYQLATIVFVGKSLPSSLNKGGQNMIEPLQSGTAVLIGPHTGNFEPLATQLCTAKAMRRVDNQEMLITAIRELLLNPNLKVQMIETGKKVLEIHQNATIRNCEFVEQILTSAL